VPCSSVRAGRVSGLRIVGLIFLRASAIAREGSSGVEKTFRVFRAPFSTHTQSVNVPPVSMAIRNQDCDALDMGAEREQGRLPLLAVDSAVSRSRISGGFRI